MKLREKILLLSGLALTACAYLLYFTSARMFLGNFQHLEEQQADESARQALQALDERIDALQAVALTWARRSDAAAFVENPTDAYKAASLSAEVLAGWRLNLVAFIRPDGGKAYATGFDYIGRRFRPVPADAEDQLLRAPQLLSRCLGGEEVKGILQTSEGPMILAANAIAGDAHKDAPHGMLVVGRFLEIREMTDLRRVSRQTLNLYPVDDPLIAGELAAARVVEPSDPPVKVGTPGVNVLTAYGILHDIFGQPALTLRTVMPRDILAEGRRTVNTFLICLIVTGLVATVIVAALFERLVLAPLARLRSDVAWTAARGVLSARLPVSGSDEVSMTAQEINRLLDTAEQIHLRAKHQDADTSTQVPHA